MYIASIIYLDTIIYLYYNSTSIIERYDKLLNRETSKGVMKMENLSLSALLDVIGELFSDEISIAVSNTEEYLYYRPSKRVDLKIRPGDPVKEGTIAYKAIHRTKSVGVHQP